MLVSGWRRGIAGDVCESCSGYLYLLHHAGSYQHVTYKEKTLSDRESEVPLQRGQILGAPAEKADQSMPGGSDNQQSETPPSQLLPAPKTKPADQ